jgi:hypothetical protein
LVNDGSTVTQSKLRKKWLAGLAEFAELAVLMAMAAFILLIEAPLQGLGIRD